MVFGKAVDIYEGIGKIKRMIKAKCYSDDRCIEVNFDATPWFEQADEKEIMDLIQYGWRRYPADAVAHFMADLDKGVAEMFQYLGFRARLETIGFECYVNKEDALIWLKENRAEQWEKILQFAD